MSGAFQFPGGSATPIAMKITGTSPTAIAGNALYAVIVAWFQVTEIAGSTTSVLTIDVYDGTTAVIIHRGLAMTAGQELLYDLRGYWLNPGQFLRVTTSTANTADVTGLATLPNTQGS